jgi:hypothetical protein
VVMVLGCRPVCCGFVLVCVCVHVCLCYVVVFVLLRVLIPFLNAMKCSSPMFLRKKRNVGKNCVHKIQNSQNLPQTLRKQELRAPGCLFEGEPWRSGCLVTMRSWVQVLETTSYRNVGKDYVHKTQSGRTFPWILCKRELRAPGCPLFFEYGHTHSF